MADVGCDSMGVSPPRLRASIACRPVASTTHLQATVAFVPSLFSITSVLPASPFRRASTTFAGRHTVAPSFAARPITCSSSFWRSIWKEGVRASCVGPVSEASRRHETFSLWNQYRKACFGSCSRERWS